MPKNEPVPLGKGTLVYIIEGPDKGYGKFEDAVKQERDYKLWSNPRFEPFSPPKP